MFMLNGREMAKVLISPVFIYTAISFHYVSQVVHNLYSHGLNLQSLTVSHIMCVAHAVYVLPETHVIALYDHRIHLHYTDGLTTHRPSRWLSG